jgi:molybdate transport system substrate-binding protein
MARSLVTTIRAANSALIAEGKLDAVGDFLTPDYVAHLTDQELAGHAPIRRFLDMLRRAFPDLSQVKNVFSSLPVFALALLFTPACGDSQGAEAGRPRVELRVYAATSTRDALQALEPTYEREHPVDLVFNFGSSSDLSNQIVAAAKADVFLSADEQEMDEVEQAELVASGTRRSLLSNQLVVIESADGASVLSRPFEPRQLASESVKLLSLGDPATVPAGRYAKAWLEQRGVWSQVSGRVLPGVDVRAALTAVESGAAQAGIVYRTDTARSEKARSVHAVPLEEGPEISYPVAVVAGRPHEAAARAFVAFLASPRGRASFEEQGFTCLPAQPATTQ